MQQTETSQLDGERLYYKTIIVLNGIVWERSQMSQTYYTTCSHRQKDKGNYSDILRTKEEHKGRRAREIATLARMDKQMSALC